MVKNLPAGNGEADTQNRFGDAMGGMGGRGEWDKLREYAGNMYSTLCKIDTNWAIDTQQEKPQQ